MYAALQLREMQITTANCIFLFFRRFKDLSKVNDSVLVVPLTGGKTTDRRQARVNKGLSRISTI